ncbi:type II toxin-antitoxin system RelE family toxin [Halanaeroarchaeum sulfurireducens]|nr:type II toxin-antitoxin system RelE/ParE family toxin [Halanaeroarchaeum sulfurireducens]
MADIEFTDKARAQLNELEDETSERILNKLKEVQDWPGHYLERLQGYPFYKIRVGDYRVIVDWEKEEKAIYVHNVGHRRNVYK